MPDKIIEPLEQDGKHLGDYKILAYSSAKRIKFNYYLWRCIHLRKKVLKLENEIKQFLKMDKEDIF